MSKQNIFDLSKLVPKSNDIEIENTYSGNANNGNTDELLVGYTEVPKDKWINIPYKSHIRYLRTDGKFVKGGFILSLVNMSDKAGIPTIKINITSTLNKQNSSNWSVYATSIDKIWKQNYDETNPNNLTNPNNVGLEGSSNEVANLKTKLNQAIEEINQLNKKNNAIIAELQRLKNDQTRMIQMISKINNKITKS
jgi:hypothetical protein